MIKANARARLTAEDFDFVVRSLSRHQENAVALADLLIDEEMRDSILDHDVLVQSLFSVERQLRVSPLLFFYILVRRVLSKAGIQDRDLADYLASLLEKFMNTAEMRSPINKAESGLLYISDLMIALKEASPAQTFMLRAHVGNYTLFVTGLFHENIRQRSERGAPDCSFYEEMGRMNYRLIAGTTLAKQAQLTKIYETLAERFHEVRLALNALGDSLINLDDDHYATPLIA